MTGQCLRIPNGDEGDTQSDQDEDGLEMIVMMM